MLLRPSNNVGCDEQIQELIETAVLPMSHKDIFDDVGGKPSKGVVCMDHLEATVKTLCLSTSYSCASQMPLSGPELFQMYIRDAPK